MLPLSRTHETHRFPHPDPHRSGSVLYWAVDGGLSIRHGDDVIECAQGQAIWVPRGPAPVVSPEAGGLTVPIAGVELGGATEARAVHVDAAWSGWLLYAYGDSLGYLDGPAAAAAIEPLEAFHDGAPDLRPPMPSSAAAIDIAQRILADVGADVRVDECAAHAGWSAKTLQRRFEAETGCTLTQWIRRARMAAAAELLTEGRDPQWVAHRLGYQTQSGFTRTFTSCTGVTPGRWRRRSGQSSGVEIEAAGAPPLPARSSWRRVNGAHVAIWGARGRAIVSIGTRLHQLCAGDAVVLPAGVPNTLRTASDSLVLPVGYRTGSDETPGTLVSPAHFPAGEYWSLVRASVAQYTAVPVRAAESAYDRVRAAAQSREPTADQHLLAVLAGSVARADDGQNRSLEQWADILSVSPDRLRGCVHREAGVGFAQWLRLSRMSRARLQLLHGTPVGNVARRLGYAHLPAFTRAFRAVYGTPPRECRSVS